MTEQEHNRHEDHVKRLIQRAREQAEDTSRDEDATVSWVRCPHCHAGVELQIEAYFQEIICPSCDEPFRIIEQDEDNSPVRIGKYELVEKIGAGGYGAVWRARDTQLEREVAVKVFHRHTEPTAIDQALTRGREILEARIAAKLKHPNIVSVLEFGREPQTGILFIISELIDGKSLAEHLRQGPLGITESVRLARTVAYALSHAHQHQVIHRDLKPANIVVDQNLQPHLTDFGLAKQVSDEVTVTLEGGVVGTIAYMSPEQARGESHTADHRSDIYSFGTVLFELLTHERPFRGDMAIVLHKVIHDDPPSPRALNSRVPRDLETICLRCLEKDPQRRYQSMKDVSDELGRWLEGIPIAARPITRPERIWRWCRRNPAVAVLTSAAICLLAVWIGTATWAARQLKADLESQVMVANRSTAERMAATTLFPLEELSSGVLTAAEDSTVRGLLKQMWQSPDDAQLQVQLNDHAANLFGQFNMRMQAQSMPAFQSLFVLDREGMLVAIAGEEEQSAADEILNESFVLRDYFQGAKAYRDQRGRNSLHISSIFKSQYDNKYKFAIAAPVVDAVDGFLGVVETSVLRGNTEELFPFETQQVLLVNRCDKNPRAPNVVEDLSEPDATRLHDFIVFFRPNEKPAFGSGESMALGLPADVIAKFREKPAHWQRLPELPPTDPLRPESRKIARRLQDGWTCQQIAEQEGKPEEAIANAIAADLRLQLTEDRDYASGTIPPYADPDSNERYLGGWARVGTTDLIVLVRRPYEEVIGTPVAVAANVARWGWIALAIALVIAGIIVWRRD